MTSNTLKLQAAFARKRETEHIRTERTTAMIDYYSHWGKITSKFQNWTAPEYYQGAEERIQKLKEKKEKEENLQYRRQKLKDLLLHENEMFQKQLALLKRPKTKRMYMGPIDESDNECVANQREKRRLELEAKLYDRWKTGSNGNLLFESKSTNQALAKLNRLGKQIENQMHSEEEEKLAQERALRLQEETRRSEEGRKHREEIRLREIQELKALQEKYVQELRQCEQEADVLKSDATFLQNSLANLNAEMKSITERKATHRQERHNLRRIKMDLRQQSQAFLDQLELDLELLKRLIIINPNEEITTKLINKLKDQRNMEIDHLRRIESMYESEARDNLCVYEEMWRKLNQEIHVDLDNVLDVLKKSVTSRIAENKHRQQQLNDVRATLLSSIEKSNESMKLLITRSSNFPEQIAVEMGNSTQEKQDKPFERLSDSFWNLTLDRSTSDAALNQRPSSESMVGRPSYSRKKVSWT